MHALLFCLALKLASCPVGGLPVYTPPPYVAPAPALPSGPSVGFCGPWYVRVGKTLVRQGSVCVN